MPIALVRRPGPHLEEGLVTFEDLGYEPVRVDIGEFQKLEGCVTCLSVRIR